MCRLDSQCRLCPCQERCCQTFQTLEEERLVYMRNLLWMTTNIHSHAAVIDDKVCHLQTIAALIAAPLSSSICMLNHAARVQCLETARVALERCSVEDDIQEFIATHSTGSERPGESYMVHWHAGLFRTGVQCLCI